MDEKLKSFQSQFKYPSSPKQKLYTEDSTHHAKKNLAKGKQLSLADIHFDNKQMSKLFSPKSELTQSFKDNQLYQNSFVHTAKQPRQSQNKKDYDYLKDSYLFNLQILKNQKKTKQKKTDHFDPNSMIQVHLTYKSKKYPLHFEFKNKNTFDLFKFLLATVKDLERTNQDIIGGTGSTEGD